MRTLFLTLIFLAGAASAASEEMQSERLLQEMPEGYTVNTQQRRGTILTIDMVPERETAQTWTEMLTSQIFFGGLKLSSEMFFTNFANLWQRSCDDSEVEVLQTGTENGYPFAFGMLICPVNSASGKPEYTLLKVMEGNANFYAVQKAWRRIPLEDEVLEWVHYLRDVRICDSRLPDRPCP